jgi:hypothetical protein
VWRAEVPSVAECGTFAVDPFVMVAGRHLSA